MAGYLGIDIGASFVRSVLVRGTTKRVSVAAFGCVPRVEGEPLSQAIRASVADALKDVKGGFDDVAVAIGGSQVTVHSLSIPGTARKQLSEVLGFELEAHVPFEMGDAVFDWLVAKDGGEKADMELLTLTARSEDVRRTIDSVKEAIDAEPSVVSAGAFPLAALAMLSLNVTPTEVVAFLDVGTRTTDVLLVRNGSPIFARTIGYGTEGMPANATALVRDLRITLVALAGQAGATVSRAFLSGGGAQLAGAQRFFEGELGVPVTEFALSSEGSLHLDAPIPEHISSYAKALGLACLHMGGRSFNLRRGALAYEGGFRWLRDQAPALAGVFAVLVVSLVFANAARWWSLSAERHTLEASLGIVTKEVFGEETTSAGRASELLEKELEEMDDDPMPHADAFDVLIKLSEAVPLSMTHDIDELDYQKGKVSVRAVVGSIPDTDAIVNTLKGERCIVDPKIKSTSQVVGGDRQKYVLDFELKCPEDVKASAKPHSAAPAAAPSGAGGN